MTLSILSYADGAASLVGKKSKTKNFTYSISTKDFFLRDCEKNANRKVCKCVLGKLQLKYSEDQYKKYDSDLRKGINRSAFVNDISNFAEECDIEYSNSKNELSVGEIEGLYLPNFAQTESYAETTQITATETQQQENTGVEISEEDAIKFVENFKENYPKKEFVKNCAEYKKGTLGKKLSQKVCVCSYDAMVSDKSRFIQMIQQSGYPEQDSAWGIEYTIDCLPEHFTPEIEKNLVKKLNEQGIPLSISKCVVKTITKEFTLKSFFKASQTNMDEIALLLMPYAYKCFQGK